MTIMPVKIRNPDRKTVRIRSKDRKQSIKPHPMRRMSDADVERAARSDPDNPPLTAAEIGRMHRIPEVKRLRWALGLTQEAFSVRYAIPLGTLRDWEQGRSEPDQPARAYLLVIAADPGGTARALAKRPAAE